MTSTIEISYSKNRFPKLFKFFTILPWAICLAVFVVILIWYGSFLFNLNETFFWIFYVALLILLYYVWWLIRWFEYIMLMIISCFHMLRYQKFDFNKILFEEKLNSQEKKVRAEIKTDISAQDIVHWFIIPTYKEDESILHSTLQAIVDSQYDKKKFAVTIAWEQRDEQNFIRIREHLSKEYEDVFGFFNFTIHPSNIEGEVIWKWANITYSAQQSYQDLLKTFDCSPDKVVVTTLDADTNIDKTYPSILTFSYLKEPNRKHKSYQPVILFFNNFWDTPFFGKIVSLGNSFFIMFNSVKKFWLRNFSTHAQPLDALIETDFWSRETIVEDGHQYRRSFFHFNGHYECVPIFTKVYQDANLNKTVWLTAKAQYNQMRRWAHGTEDIPYVFSQWMANFKNLPFFRTLYEFLRLFEGIILWGTLHIILMSWMALTLVRDIKISSYISLGWTIGVFISISFIILIFSVSLQLIFMPWYQIKSAFEKLKQVLKFGVLFYVFIWPTLLIFTWIPAIHSILAIMLGKPMKKFNVTEKIRKPWK